MAGNNIDFVIGAKDQSKTAMASVEKSLDRLNQKTESLGRATINLSSLAGGLAAAYGILKSSMAISGIIENANAAYDEAAGKTGIVAQMNERASAAIGRLMVSIGTILAPIRALISAGLETMAHVLDAVLSPAVEAATAMLQNIGPVMQWIREQVVAAMLKIIEVFTFWEVVITNLDSIWIAAVAQTELYMLQMAGVIEHALTVVIPEYAKWFADNFVNLIKDAFNATIAVVTNAGKILGEAVYQIFEFIASGGEGGIDQLMENMGHAASMSLLDGFESQLSALPEIAERAITQREKDLASVVGSVGDTLGKEFNDKFQSRIKAIESFVGSDIKATIDTANKPDIKKKSSGGNNTLSASESRLLTRGQGSDPMDKTNRILASIERQEAQNAKIYTQQLEASRTIAANTAGGKTNLVPVS